jgi:hypothetical protein
MEKQSSQLIPAALFLAIGLGIAGYFIGNALVKARKLDRSVVVKGLAEREVDADLAIWPIKVFDASNNLSELERSIKTKSERIREFLNEQGFSSREISSGIPTITDAWANPYGGNQQNAYRYSGNFEITVRTSDIEKLDAAINGIAGLIGEGIVIGQNNYWQQVEYLYTKLNEIKPEMIEEATKNAREAAEKFAVDSKSEVGKIKRANQGLFTISNRDMNSPQIKKVRVVSTIEFYLKD